MGQPTSFCVAVLAALVSISAARAGDSLRYWENFHEIPFEKSGEGYIDALDWKGTVRLAGSFEWNGTTDISTFTRYSQFGVWLSMGEPFGVGYGSILGEDPEYHHGKREVVWKLCHLEEITWNRNRVVRDGMLWLNWDDKGFRFVLSGRIHDYSALGTGLGIGFRRDNVGAFTNTPSFYIYFVDAGGNVGFETNRGFPIVGGISRRAAFLEQPVETVNGTFYDYTITSMALVGPMLLEPQQEQPRWLRRRLRIARLLP